MSHHRGARRAGRFLVAAVLVMTAGCLRFTRSTPFYANAPARPAAAPRVAPPVLSLPGGDVACRPDAPRHYNGYFCLPGQPRVVEPADAAAAAAVVRDELLHGNGPIRVLGAAHSGNELVCGEGLVVRTTRMRRVVGLESVDGEMTVVAEAAWTVASSIAGCTSAATRSAAPRSSSATPPSAAPIATAAHGSTLAGSSVFSDSCAGCGWSPRARGGTRRDYVEPDETRAATVDVVTWSALRSHLGALGLVTKVRLAVEPDYNLRVRVRYEYDHLLWRDGGVAELMKGCTWGQIHWFPRAGGIVWMCGEPPPMRRTGRGHSCWIRSTGRTSLALFKGLLEATGALRGNLCTAEKFRYLHFRTRPPQEKTATSRDGVGAPAAAIEVVGPAWQMMSSTLTPVSGRAAAERL